MRFLFLPVLLVTLAFGPLAHALPKPERPLSVVATTTVVADLCRIIGGDRLNVASVVGPNQDPHTFRPSYKELAVIKSADILVSIGLNLEAGLGRVLEQVATNKPLITLAASISPGALIREGGPAGTPDPHFWGDVSLWAVAGEYLARELGAIDVGSRQDYLRRGEEYRRRLMVLHRGLLITLTQPPSSQRILATPHGSLAYFGAAYGWSTISPAGMTPMLPGNGGALTTFVKQVHDQKVSLLFAETTLSSQILDDAIVRLTEEGGRISLRGELWVDALGPSDSPVSTYEAMMRTNAEILMRAVGDAAMAMAPQPRDTAPTEPPSEPEPSPTADTNG